MSTSPTTAAKLARDRSIVMWVIVVFALVLLVDFFMGDWISWCEVPPIRYGPGASFGVSSVCHGVGAIALATKGGLYALWLVLLSALAVLLGAYLELRLVGQRSRANDNIVLGAGLLGGVTVLFLDVTALGTNARPRLQLVGRPIESVGVGGGAVAGLVLLAIIVICGYWLRRSPSPLP